LFLWRLLCLYDLLRQLRLFGRFGPLRRLRLFGL
jgi:hypothetical protein